ncbi:MAG: lysylphosphatidylglycerol synthase domain-containing protein [Armatimonadota bacterium]|jgi:uncharacterized membrane protein YbhN (UPF0104 family)
MRSFSINFKRILLSIAKFLVAIIVLYLAIRQITGAVKGLDLSTVRLSPFYLLLSGLLYLTGMAFFGSFWRIAAADMGGKMGHKEALRAYLISQLGKYVPGKAWVPMMRCALVDRNRSGVAVTAISSIYETLIMMAVGALISVITLLFGGIRQTSVLAAAGAIAICFGVFVQPFVFQLLIKMIQVFRKGSNEFVSPVRYSTMVRGIYIESAGWLLLGLSLAAVAAAVGIPMWSFKGLMLMTGNSALAIAGGFVAVVVPAGLGVRTSIMIFTLSPLIGAGPAAMIGLVMRIVQIVSELIVSGVFYFFGSRSGSND